MVRVITALVSATLAAVVSFSAASATSAAPGDVTGNVVLAGNHWCC
jgi:hypothetical protein